MVDTEPASLPVPALEASSLVKHFPVYQRDQGRPWRRRVVHAVDGVSLSLHRGEVTALVGESGSGKSTVARLLARLYPPTAGTIRLFGEPVGPHGRRTARRYSSEVQLILQDPFSSLNPVHTVEYHLKRPLRIHGYARSEDEIRSEIDRLLREVNLTPVRQIAESFPHELSGGQRQRVAIARALAARPSVILADEPVSMLDVSIRLGILNVLERLAIDRGLALLYITHDIASARYSAARTLVMYAGQLAEGGPSEEVTQEPAHPYSRLLVDSAPDPEHIGESRLGAGHDTSEPPSLIVPPTGCRFHPRCPHAMDICTQAFPPTVHVSNGHWTNCWLHVPEHEQRVEIPNAGAP